MFTPERQQIRSDFGLAPELVRRYVGDVAQEEALTMVRQVNGVTTYLSWMSTGEVRLFEGTVYAVGIAGMDVVTDVLKKPVSDGATEAALNGHPPMKELEALSLASDVARGPCFDHAVRRIAEWQDRSLQQFESPDEERLRDITRKKGGYSALAHLHAVKRDVTPAEDKFMLTFGETMQLLDDYLDQPGDEAEGISTLFTEGHMDGDDLLDHIEVTERKARGLWGDTEAVRRFGKVMRAHRRLGQVENTVPGAAERLLPWYF